MGRMTSAVSPKFHENHLFGDREELVGCSYVLGIRRGVALAALKSLLVSYPGASFGKGLYLWPFFQYICPGLESNVAPG